MASKVAWVGRTASMVLGLALVLALMIGAASTAWSATGGNFLLGKANGADRVSKLTASIAGPALTLVNQSTESAATALNLNVAEDKPPLKVNAAAGTAKNLSADELDGKSSEQFANAAHPHSGEDITSGTVADARIDGTVARDGEVMPTVTANDGPDSGLDADKLDGQDSGAFASASHEHDNRYSPKLFAAIRGTDATAIRSSNLQATFKYLGRAGSYEIVFNRDIRTCVYTATLINETAGRGDEAPNGEIGVRPLATSYQGVSVTTYDSSGTRADRDFSIVVHC